MPPSLATASWTVLSDIDEDAKKGVDPSLYAEVATTVARTDERSDAGLKMLMELGSAADTTTSMKELMPPKEEEEGADSNLADIDDEGPPLAKSSAAMVEKVSVEEAKEASGMSKAAAIINASGDDMTANLLLVHGLLWRWHRSLGVMAAELPAKDEWLIEAAEKEAKFTKGFPITFYQHLLCRFHAVPKKNIEKGGKMTLNKMVSGAAIASGSQRDMVLELA